MCHYMVYSQALHWRLPGQAWTPPNHHAMMVTCLSGLTKHFIQYVVLLSSLRIQHLTCHTLCIHLLTRSTTLQTAVQTATRHMTTVMTSISSNAMGTPAPLALSTRPGMSPAKSEQVLQEACIICTPGMISWLTADISSSQQIRMHHCPQTCRI